VERGTYSVESYRGRTDKVYAVLCNQANCKTVGHVWVSHAWHVPQELRKIGWRTRAGRWVCPDHA